MNTGAAGFICCHQRSASGCFLIPEVIISLGAAAVTAGVSVREKKALILTSLFLANLTYCSLFVKTTREPKDLRTSTSTRVLGHQLPGDPGF